MVDIRVPIALLLSAGLCFGQATTPANLGSAKAPAADATTAANPAMWKVQGVKGTIYLFGSVHVMKPSVHWETAKEQAAFKSSGTLYLEIADTSPAAQAALRPMIMSIGIDQEHPLSTKISKEDVAALDDALKAMGGEKAIEPMQPWLAYLTLSVVPMIQAGYDPMGGIDPQLQKEAEAAHKPIKGFETAEEQMHFFADFPQADQVALLHEELQELPKSGEKFDEVVASWSRGDVEKIAQVDDGELRQKHPELYKRLLVDRNAKIADTLASLLKDPATGTIFVAVGAGHLAGPDSIQKMLEQRGFTAAREE
jgi:uncharacterized protein YbaP (TraB family)